MRVGVERLCVCRVRQTCAAMTIKPRMSFLRPKMSPVSKTCYYCLMSKDCLLVKGLSGEPRLSGEVRISGAKNAALPLIAASILFDGAIFLRNVPKIEDVDRMLELLEMLGVSFEKDGEGGLKVDATEFSFHEFERQIAKRLRASIIAVGPVLARLGKVSFPHPGGCVIGARPIDIFLDAFRKMGAVVSMENERYEINAPKGLHGAEIFFPIQSVTVTETLVMAAVGASGETILKNCSMEPEVVSLCEVLRISGAIISGIGTPTLVITGVGCRLVSKETIEVIPDRIDAGSFIILGALLGNKLTIQNCVPSHLDALLNTLGQSGVDFSVGKNSVSVSAANLSRHKAVSVKTHEYPGFPTDLQAPMAVFLTQAEGESLVFETIFDGRLTYTEDLARMGASIQLWNSHNALIKGPTPLKGRELEGPDLRAGLAYIIAALVADGESVVTNVYNIDRGYEKIDERLRKIGAQVSRVSQDPVK